MDGISEERRYDVPALKAWLKRYREKERDIDNQIERLERLTAKMTNIGSQVLTDMPREPSPSNDRLASLVDQKDKLENTIREEIKTQSEDWDEIESFLNQLRKSDEKAIIRMRYHDGEDWSTVAMMIFGGRPDYEERQDSYQRLMYKLHGYALQNMAKVIDTDWYISHQNG